MKILKNIGQNKYFQISGVNGVFAGLWVRREIIGTTQIYLDARNQGQAIENGLLVSELPFGIGSRINQINYFQFNI